MKFNLIAFTLLTVSTFFAPMTKAVILDPRNILEKLDKEFNTPFSKAFKNEVGVFKVELCAEEGDEFAQTCQVDRLNYKTQLLDSDTAEISYIDKESEQFYIFTSDMWRGLNKNPIRFYFFSEEDTILKKALAKAQDFNVKIEEEDNDSEIVSFEYLNIIYLGKLVPGVRVTLETKFELEGGGSIIIPMVYEFAKEKTLIKTLSTMSVDFLGLASIKFELEK